ncbi:unnamed protein product, partial [Iphiclides podalirius]
MKKKSEANKKKLNPFEVHINREKLKVLGKKSKHDRGLPGVSRAKAIKKRKETLGVEMKVMNKTNAFIDRRIGEKNNQLSAEDRMIARFAAERAKQHSKKNIYNLADDEILTHRGQTLEQIEKFDDPRSDEEDDDFEKKFGGLDNDFVSEGHFGGGILSKTDAQDGAKSHKDLIEQLIAESKKRKAEKQKEKEQTLDLTEKLDSEWKDLQPVVFKKARVEEESVIDKVLSKAEKGQDYDKMMRELRFEKRGTPSDGLKSTEKQEAEERKKLEELEKQRQLRMLSEEEAAVPNRSQPTAKHRSADDLDDNFELDDERDFMLAYDKDGKPLVPEQVLKDFSVPNAKPKFDDGISDTSSEDDGEDESDEEASDDEAADAENKSIEKKKEQDIEIRDQQQDISSSDNDDDENQSSEEENTEEYKQSQAQILSEVNGISNKDVRSEETKEDEEEGSDDEAGSDDEQSVKGNEFDNLEDLKESKEESEVEDEHEEESKETIESFFDLKAEEGVKLKELLTGKSPSQQSAALQKLIKSYDPSQSANNKELLSRLFAHLLQYVNDLFHGLKDEGGALKSFLMYDKLLPHFYDLAHTNKVSAKRFICELLKEKHDKYTKSPRKVPDLDTLVFFKLISAIYPTSDFRHPVTTPSVLFMCEILTSCRFRDAYSISRGLFLVSLILEYTALSKRYAPAAVNFLRGLLYLSADTSVLNPVQVVPPFKLHGAEKVLRLERECTSLSAGDRMSSADLVADSLGERFKVNCLYNSVLMLREYFDNCCDMEAQGAIFEPHIKLMDRIDLDLYPKKVAKAVKEVARHMKATLEVKTYTPLARERKRPKALRLYEPDIQEVFTGSKSSKLSREKAEKARLESKYKKEMKGALREIRRDKAYIASVKIRQKIQSDIIRKDKVKQIYKDASIQQGELNKLKRMK